MSKREAVSQFWDDVIRAWMQLERFNSSDLDRWFKMYEGRERSAVNLMHYPDPFVGDLRGVRRTPRLVTLGLNPGVGYDELQSRTGLWARRIAEARGYSYCFGRSPAEDP